jgi:hypothetical protein
MDMPSDIPNAAQHHPPTAASRLSRSGVTSNILISDMMLSLNFRSAIGAYPTGFEAFAVVDACAWIRTVSVSVKRLVYRNVTGLHQVLAEPKVFSWGYFVD